MSKYTILHTIETWGTGGAETILLNLASKLDSNRFRCLAVLPRDGWLNRRLQEAGVPTFLIWSEAWYDFRLPVAMARVVREQNVDLIHSHLPDQNFYGCLVGRLTGRKTIVTYHGSERLSKAEGVKCATKLWLVRRSATAVVVVSAYLEQIVRAAGFSPNKIVRIYNGVDMERYRSTDGARLRTELDCQNGAKLVGMVANWHYNKGYEHFVRAARLVVDAMPETRFVAIGEIEGKFAVELANLAQQLRLQDRFFFLGFREDVPQILRDLDVFVLSSVSEGFSLATVEAMAAGKPVIVTRSGGPEEIVEEGRTGLFVPPGDPGALAARIIEVLGNPERAAALGRSARAKAESTFSLSAMLSEYEKLYERCLTSN